MRILLDTQIALWLAIAPGRIASDTRDLVSDARTELMFSAASAWEIAVKYEIGKLPLPEPPSGFVPELRRRLRLTEVPVEIAHGIRAGGLPAVHRDPFDRMLVAQAQILEAPIMTVDPNMGQYDVEVIAAY